MQGKDEEREKKKQSLHYALGDIYFLFISPAMTRFYVSPRGRRVTETRNKVLPPDRFSLTFLS